jgi:hypothetical protein
MFIASWMWPWLVWDAWLGMWLPGRPRAPRVKLELVWSRPELPRICA